MLNQNVISKEEHSWWLDGLSRRKDSKFWVVFLNTVPVGTAYLQNINYETATSEWGFYIGEDEYRGKGLGRQILFQLLEEVFNGMGLVILKTQVLSGNDAAIHLYRKFHFIEKKRFLSHDGRDVLLFEYTSQDWARTKEELKAMCAVQH